MLRPYLIPDIRECGCDEAGRGCLAGPVFAAAVILPPDFTNNELNDSKQLTEKQRYRLRPIIENAAIAWSIGKVTAQEIDKINILNASILAMHRAIEQLKIIPLKPGEVLQAGNSQPRSRAATALPTAAVSAGSAATPPNATGPSVSSSRWSRRQRRASQSRSISEAMPITWSNSTARMA